MEENCHVIGQSSGLRIKLTWMELPAVGLQSWVTLGKLYTLSSLLIYYMGGKWHLVCKNIMRIKWEEAQKALKHVPGT